MSFISLAVQVAGSIAEVRTGEFLYVGRAVLKLSELAVLHMFILCLKGRHPRANR